jgi:hypothetical protein
VLWKTSNEIIVKNIEFRNLIYKNVEKPKKRQKCTIEKTWKNLPHTEENINESIFEIKPF